MSAGPQHSSVELQRRREHASYQIFPEPSEQPEPEPEPVKERLPSIVVELSEESGGLQWPPLHTQTSINEEEEEDPFQDHCEPISAAQEEQTKADGAPRFKRASIPGVQIDCSRLTPPPSPTSSHSAPPRFLS
ncbi:protein phosphatase 1E-like [Carassius auratus]|uniref:Protein phosphatase 1E-like n=1 Tax=Carassius auratus TaxID=7957 RepID=A0A6P6KYB8_CARAU|nr:protein phosphatase 1E-like [Carassius auratus]